MAVTLLHHLPAVRYFCYSDIVLLIQMFHSFFVLTKTQSLQALILYVTLFSI